MAILRCGAYHRSNVCELAKPAGQPVRVPMLSHRGYLVPKVPSVRVLAVIATAIIAIALGLTLGWMAIRGLAWGEAGQILRSVSPWLLASSVTLVILAGVLRAYRWHRLLAPKPVSTGRLFMIEQTGTALDTLSVIHLLDEVVETGILTERDDVPLGKVLATLAMQRTLEFGTTVIVLGGAALLLGPMQPYRGYLVGGIAVSLTALVLLFTAGPALAKLPVLDRLHFVAQFSEAAELLRSDWRGALVAFGLSVAQALVLGVAGWLLAVSLGVELSVLPMLAITLGVLFFGSTVPGLPLAFGTYEFAAVSLFALWGRPDTEAVSFTLLLRANVYIPPLIFAAVFLPKEGLASARSVLAMCKRSAAGSVTRGTA